MMNAHILYKTVKSDQDTVLNLQDFLLEIISSLLGATSINRLKAIGTSVQKIASGASSAPAQAPQVDHWIKNLDQPQPQQGKRKRREDCAHCSTDRSRSRTQIFCPACPGLPGRHPDCFYDFHARKFRAHPPPQ